MKQIYMRLGFHQEVSLQIRPLGQEWDIPVQDIDLAAFGVDNRERLADGEAADYCTGHHRDQHDALGEFYFLIEILYKHDRQ